MDVDSLSNEKDIANMMNDQQTSEFHIKEDFANRAADELRKANKRLMELRILRESEG